MVYTLRTSDTDTLTYTCAHTGVWYVVSQKLSEADRKVLKEEGVSLPRVGRRKGRRREREREREGEGDTEGRGKAEAEWQEVRRLMDPNPQLKGVDPGKYAPKVTKAAHGVD